jgi:hypothetical protein
MEISFNSLKQPHCQVAFFIESNLFEKLKWMIVIRNSLLTSRYEIKTYR